MRRFTFGSLLVIVLAAGLVGCGSSSGDAAVTAAPSATRLITPADAAALLASPPSDLVIVDVRTPEEFAAGHLAGAIDLDLRSSTFDADLALLDHTLPYLVYCHSGNRSAMAVQAMQQLGFTDVAELQGGITAWQDAGYPVTR